MCWCVVMQNILVVTQPELRPFTRNGFLQTMTSRSVYLQRLVQLFDDNLSEHIQIPMQHCPSSMNRERDRPTCSSSSMDYRSSLKRRCHT
ncbi:hypothetical protein TNCV_3519111 [Trichonephila clavipes]|uniref:Uncharacterized protein n=1 Tax=Trichonephila clavipes TaxID=2585209 RepID=A0A8X6T090_TRICX|nr:hypothetical protein TNCV_3519111 [Trichonephila clavipes]